MIGVSNVNDGTMTQIYANILAKGEQLRNDSQYPNLGGRIVQGPDDVVVKRGLLADEVVATFSFTGALPMNRFDATILAKVTVA